MTNEAMPRDPGGNSRRDFIVKAAYAAPAILSLQAYSALAKAGSSKSDDSGSDEDNEKGKKAKKALCELRNRSRVRRGLAPFDC